MMKIQMLLTIIGGLLAWLGYYLRPLAMPMEANLVFYPMIIVGFLTMIFGLLGIFDEIKRKKSLRKTR